METICRPTFAKGFKSILLALLMFSSMTDTAAASSVWTLSYSGRLTESNGKPIKGPVNLEVSFWDAAIDGTRLDSVDLGNVNLSNGVFSVGIELNQTEFQNIFGEQSRIVFIQVRDNTQNKTYPRQRFYAVPYAMKVPVDGSTIQFDANGQLKAVGSGSPGTNTVSTNAIQDNAVTSTKLSAGSVNASHLASSGCAASQVLQYNGSTWACVTIAGTSDAGSLTSGSLADARLSSNVSKLGSSIDETEVSANAINSSHIKNGQVLRSKIESCGINQILQYDGTIWQCAAAPTNNNAAGLTSGTLDDARLSANVSKLGSSIDETEVSANAINSSHIKNGQILRSKLESCGINQILQYDGTIWLCAAVPSNNNAGGLTSGTLDDARLSANVSKLGSSIDATELSANSVNSTHIIDGSITASKIASGAINQFAYGSGSINSTHLSSSGCTANQILKFNGTGWSCAADNTGAATTDASALTTGTLADARLSANVSKLGSSIDATELSANSVNSTHIIGSSITAEKLALPSVNFYHLSSTGCTANQILKFNGTNWACAADDTSNAWFSTFFDGACQSTGSRFAKSLGGSQTISCGSYGIEIGGSTNGFASLKLSSYILDAVWPGNEFVFQFHAQDPVSTNVGSAYLGVGGVSVSAGTDHNFNNSHIGVKIVWTASGAVTYATVGNGASETAVALSGTTNSTRRIRIKLSTGKVEYFDGGTLVATITTNIPSSIGTDLFQASTFRSSGAAGRTTIYLDSFAYKINSF